VSPQQGRARFFQQDPLLIMACSEDVPGSGEHRDQKHSDGVKALSRHLSRLGIAFLHTQWWCSPTNPKDLPCDDIEGAPERSVRKPS